MGLLETVQGYVEVVMPSLNRIVIFFLILLIGFLAGKVLGRLVRRLLKEVGADAFVKRALGAKLSVERLLGGLTAGIVYTVSVILALDAAGFDTAVVVTLTVVLFISVILGAFVALRDFVPNALAYFTLRRRKAFAPGARIEVGDVKGTIVEVSLVDTTLKTKKEEMVVVPNAYLTRRAYRLGGKR